MELTWQSHPEVTLGTSKFIDVPTIIQVRDTPLLQVGKFETAGYTTQFPVYHADGGKIAVVKGSQIYRTDEGKRARIEVRHEPNLTAFELEGKTILELRRHGSAALKGWAELYAPEGVLIKVVDSGVATMLTAEGHLLLWGTTMVKDFECIGMEIGIHIQDDKAVLGAGKRLRRDAGAHFTYLGPPDDADLATSDAGTI